MAFLTLGDLDLKGKCAFLRVDMNCPVDPKTGGLIEVNRIEEAAMTIRDLSKAKVVVGSHQGRVGRYDFISMEQHSGTLSKILGKEVQYVEDIFGSLARKRIDSLKEGEVLLLENLRFSAEENMEFTPEDAAKTIMVQRLYKHFDSCVLDAFPTAHRAHPSIVGFSHLLPTCAGRLVEKEITALSKILTNLKGVFTAVLGGAKISDRLEAIDALAENKRANKVLLGGMIGNLFLRAAGKIPHPIGVSDEDWLLEKAKRMLSKYPDVFEMPVDGRIPRNGRIVDVTVGELRKGESFHDIGPATIDNYSRIINSSGTTFMSGPPGAFEDPRFARGTESILRAMASSLGHTIISGGHLTAALKRYGITGKIDHVSSAGGALVLYLSGKKLPLIQAIESAAERRRAGMS